MPDLDKENAIATLNRILEQELAGVVRYAHDSLMVYGYGRIPIVSWLEAQPTEAMTHAETAGEMITMLGGHPSLAIGPLLDSHQHDIGGSSASPSRGSRRSLVLRVVELAGTSPSRSRSTRAR